MFLVTSLSCQGQIKEPGFTGDKIEVILQVTCFLNYWEVASGLQPLLWLAELIFVEKKKRPFKKIFQLPFNYGKRDDKKSSFFSLSESHAGRLLSCVFVCDPNSFLMRVGADAAGMSEEKEVEREVFILNFGEWVVFALSLVIQGTILERKEKKKTCCFDHLKNICTTFSNAEKSHIFLCKGSYSFSQNAFEDGLPQLFPL